MEGDYLMQAPAQIKHRKAPLKTRLWNYKWFYVMFLPVFVALIVFHYLPMFGISLAFFRYQPSKIANPLEFTGLANFQKLFSRPQFWSSFTNTLEISIIKLLLNTFMAVIISLLLNEMVSTKMKKLSQTIIYLPHFMSWVVTAGVFGMLFAPTSAGLVNQVLIQMGLIDKEIYFLGDNDWWRFSYYIINIWHDTGWGTIIFMATLTGIDPGIYEAASIDGAGRWKKMRYITQRALLFPKDKPRLSFWDETWLITTDVKPERTQQAFAQAVSEHAEFCSCCRMPPSTRPRRCFKLTSITRPSTAAATSTSVIPPQSVCSVLLWAWHWC